MQANPKFIDDKEKKFVFKKKPKQNNFIQNYGFFDEYLEKNGVNLYWATTWQKLMSNNKVRSLFVVISCWLFSFLVTLLLSVFFSDNKYTLANIGEVTFMATMSLLFIFVAPAVLIPFESFLYKWKAQKLRNLFLRDFNFEISKRSLFVNELDIYISLKKFFVEKSKEYKTENLWSLKVIKVWKDWPSHNNIYPDGFLKTGYYFMNNFAGKNYTVRSRNDVVRMLSGGEDFEKRLDKVFLDRNAKPQEVKKLIDDFFFTLLVADEMNREYQHLFGEKHKENMEKHGYAIVI